MSYIRKGKTLKSVSACHFAHDLQKQIGEVQSVTRQRIGTLLLEVQTDVQIAKIRSLKYIVGLEVKVEVHPTLNLCRKVDGNFVPATTLILTFDRPFLPDRIRCGFFNLLSAAVYSKSLALF